VTSRNQGPWVRGWGTLTHSRRKARWEGRRWPKTQPRENNFPVNFPAPCVQCIKKAYILPNKRNILIFCKNIENAKQIAGCGWTSFTKFIKWTICLSLLRICLTLLREVFHKFTSLMLHSASCSKVQHYHYVKNLRHYNEYEMLGGGVPGHWNPSYQRHILAQLMPWEYDPRALNCFAFASLDQQELFYLISYFECALLCTWGLAGFYLLCNPTFHPVYPRLPQVTHVSPCLPSFNPSYPRFTPFTLIYPQVTHVSPCLPSFNPSYPRFTLFTPIYPKLPTFNSVYPHLPQVTHVSPGLPSFTSSYPRFTLFTVI